MGEHEVRFCDGHDAQCRQGRDGGDEAVDQHHLARLRGAHDGAGQHDGLEAAVFAQGIFRRHFVGGSCRGRLQDAYLPREVVVVQARAPSGEAADRQTEQLGRNEARRRGIANAHLAEAGDFVTRFAADALALGQRATVLSTRHGRLFDRVVRAVADAGRNKPGASRTGPRTPASTRANSTPSARAMTFGGRTAGEEVLQHLPGHLPGIGGYAGLGDAVVGGEHGQPAAVGRGLEGLLYLGDLRR